MLCMVHDDNTLLGDVGIGLLKCGRQVVASPSSFGVITGSWHVQTYFKSIKDCFRTLLPGWERRS